MVGRAESAGVTSRLVEKEKEASLVKTRSFNATSATVLVITKTNALPFLDKPTLVINARELDILLAIVPT
jgi:hypothetical protein